MTLDEPQVRRLRDAFEALGEDARPTDDCPPAEQLWQAATGELSGSETREIGLHVVTCPACAESWRLAHELVAEITSAERPAEQPIDEGVIPFPTRPRRTTWVAWAATAAAAAALALVFLLPVDRLLEGQITPSYRAPFDEPMRSLLPAGEPLSRDDCVLRWSGPDDAVYDVWVAREDLTVLATAQRLQTGQYRVPDAALAELPPDARLIWQVEAVLADGTRQVSRTFVTDLTE
jgi:hypothetical protein